MYDEKTGTIKLSFTKPKGEKSAMSNLITILTGLSLVALASLSVHRLILDKNWKQFAAQMLGLGLCVFVLNLAFDFPFIGLESVPRGVDDEWKFIVVMYIFMVLGMAAQFAYNHYSKPRGKRRKKFDFGLFIAPFFASPIIFIPLLAAFMSADIDLSQEHQSRIMLFFVAFENGFFWKDYFDHKRITGVQNESNQ